MPAGTTVSEHIGGDTGITSLAGLSGELENVQQQGMGGRVGGAVVKQGQQAADAGREGERRRGRGRGGPGDGLRQRQPGAGLLRPAPAADHARASWRRPIPAWSTALVAHEGIGVVAGYVDEDTPVVLGKGGQRNLHTGEVTGVDPLLPYGDVALRGAGRCGG